MRGVILRRLWALTLAIAGATAACTSTETSTALVAPSAEKCQVDAASNPAAFPAGGGQGTLTVSTTRDCTWSVATSASWIAVSSSNGQGAAAIPFTVASNPVPSARAATFAVGARTVEVTQSAAPCRYSWASAGANVGADGGRLDANLNTLSGCVWTASSDASWLRIVSSASGNASAVVSLSADANSGPQRTGHVSAGGQTFTVTQDARREPTPPPTPPPPQPPPPSPPPPPQPPPPQPPPPVVVAGPVSALSGKCPGVTFTVQSTSFVADRNTKYAPGGDCGKLRNGRSVLVGGTPQPDQTVLATSIVFDPND